MGQIGFFDTNNILEKLSKQGDPLESLHKAIEWNIFRPLLKRLLSKPKKSNAGRPPFDSLMMFKILILQHLYNLSDAQMQFQLLDRYSFKRFIGIDPEDRVPDEKTIWLFREELTRKGGAKKLFNRFESFLTGSGFKAQKGMIVDASIVEVPRQRNSREDNKDIKKGCVPEDWEKNPSKKSQKDTDARWLKKNGKNNFGYKDHICIDNKHKLIRRYEVTPASVHDSECLFDVLDEGNSNKSVWADSAYRSQEIEDDLKECNIRSRIHKKGYRNKKLSEFQQKLNTKKSSVRARVEHVFGRMHMLHGNFIRCIGQLRADSKIGITNLVYNMTRYEFLTRFA